MSLRCDFYVLDDLCVDVVLSNEYLFYINIFSKHEDWFIDVDYKEDITLFCGIRLLSDTSEGALGEYPLNKQHQYPLTIPSNISGCF